MKKLPWYVERRKVFTIRVGVPNTLWSEFVNCCQPGRGQYSDHYIYSESEGGSLTEKVYDWFIANGAKRGERILIDWS